MFTIHECEFRSRETESAGLGKQRYTYYEMRTIESTEPVGTYQKWVHGALHFFENYRREIFWVTLYTLVVFGIFIERAYCKSQLRQVNDRFKLNV